MFRLILLIASFGALLGPSVASAQILQISILPREPVAGDEVRLHISLAPRDLNPAEPLSVKFRVRRNDIGQNGVLAPLHEETYEFRILDNGDLDRAPLLGRIEAPVYQVPRETPPTYYEVIVEHSGTTRMNSLTVPILHAEDKGVLPSLIHSLKVLAQLGPKRVWDLTRMSETVRTAENEPKGVSIISVGAQNGHSRLVASTDVGHIESLAWSMDGKRLVFEFHKNGASVIAFVDHKGSKPRLLTKGPADSSPVWAPDGKHVFFLRDGKLYSVRRRSKPQCALTSVGNLTTIFAVLERDKGRVEVVFAALGSGARGPQRLFVTALDSKLGSEKTWEIPYDPMWFVLRSISPVDNQLAVVENGNLCVLRADSAKETQVLRKGAFCDSPAWSPDGKTLAVLSQ